MSPNFIFYTILLHTLIDHTAAGATLKSEKSATTPGVRPTPALIAFGDSILDPGNNNHFKTVTKANFPPYGKDFEGGVATGRFSNGKIPSDFLVQALGIKPLLPAFLDPFLRRKDLLTGVSFASGGSGYDPLTPTIEVGISVSKQLIFFKEFIQKLKEQVGTSETDYIIRNSQYLIVAGSNDIAITYFTYRARERRFDVPSYVNFLIDHASNFFSELHALGARRMLIAGVPPLGCLPAIRTLKGGKARDCAEKVNEASQLYNSKFKANLVSLKTKLPQANMTYIDLYDFILDIIQHPEQYGFKVSDRGCCGAGGLEAGVFCNPLIPVTCRNTSTSVFWDAYHLTERTYKIVSDYITSTYRDNLF
uniref:Uncharacterized protein n=1 Tax=Kalanchoe fedtschenkoi TaxID=63787 RepID=A0A7N0T4J7_KALFE